MVCGRRFSLCFMHSICVICIVFCGLGFLYCCKWISFLNVIWMYCTILGISMYCVVCVLIMMVVGIDIEMHNKKNLLLIILWIYKSTWVLLIHQIVIMGGILYCLIILWFSIAKRKFLVVGKRNEEEERNKCNSNGHKTNLPTIYSFSFLIFICLLQAYTWTFLNGKLTWKSLPPCEISIYLLKTFVLHFISLQNTLERKRGGIQRSK
jgi:hypothetical protein